MGRVALCRLGSHRVIVFVHEGTEGDAPVSPFMVRVCSRCGTMLPYVGTLARPAEADSEWADEEWE